MKKNFYWSTEENNKHFADFGRVKKDLEKHLYHLQKERLSQLIINLYKKIFSKTNLLEIYLLLLELGLKMQDTDTIETNTKIIKGIYIDINLMLLILHN